MSWEKRYIEASIDALKPEGDVLEVGFEKGYAAGRIESFKPKSHTIIDLKAEFPKALVIHGNWKEALNQLGVFDAIFFNEPTLQVQLDMMRAIQESNDDLCRGRQVVDVIQSKVQHMPKAHFTEKDFDEFYQTMGQIQSR